MSRTHLWLLLAITLTGPTAATVEGQPPRCDAYGDPLPAGAVARLGTTRFRIPDGVREIAAGPDTHVWAAVSNGGNGYFFDPATGRELRRFTGKSMSADQLAFSPDGRALALAGYGGVRVLDTVTGAELFRHDKAPNRSGLLSLSAGGTVLAQGTESNRDSIQVWDLATKKSLGPFKVLQTDRLHAVLSTDGRLLATWGYYSPSGRGDPNADADHTVQLWSVAEGKEVHRFKADRSVRQAGFAPDGKALVVASEQSLFLWGTANGQLLRRFAGRQGTGTALAFSRDGQTVFAATERGVVQGWDVATGRRLGVYEGPTCRLRGLVPAEDGRLFAWGERGQTIFLWDVQGEKVLTPTGGHNTVASALAFLDDGRRLASASADGEARVWDPTRGKELRRFLFPDEEMYVRRGNRLDSLAFSPGGTYLAAIGSPLQTCLVEFRTGREVCSVPATGWGSGALTFSADGSVILTTGQDGSVMAWSATTGQELWRLSGVQVENKCLALSPDGKIVAAAGADPRQQGGQPYALRTWALTGGKVQLQLPLQEALRALAFSPDGTLLAGLNSSGPAICWKSPTGEEVRRLTGPPDRYFISPLFFSPDGRLAAAGGRGTKVPAGFGLVWEVATGTVRHTLDGHRQAVMSLAFSPDGRKLATGSLDTTILIWDLDGDAQPAGEPLPERELEALWTRLVTPEAADALPALRRLAAAPGQTVPFLAKRIVPVRAVVLDDKTVERLIADLDANEFAVRDRATRALEELGRPTKSHLLRALERKLSTEQRRRLEGLLSRLDQPNLTDDRVRLTRALEVLERVGTPDARRLVEKLADGDPEVALTREATAVLKRLSARAAADRSPTSIPPK